MLGALGEVFAWFLVALFVWGLIEGAVFDVICWLLTSTIARPPKDKED